jgi:hypothetical protein
MLSARQSVNLIIMHSTEIPQGEGRFGKHVPQLKLSVHAYNIGSCNVRKGKAEHTPPFELLVHCNSQHRYRQSCESHAQAARGTREAPHTAALNDACFQTGNAVPKSCLTAMTIYMYMIATSPLSCASFIHGSNQCWWQKVHAQQH